MASVHIGLPCLSPGLGGDTKGRERKKKGMEEAKVDQCGQQQKVRIPMGLLKNLFSMSAVTNFTHTHTSIHTYTNTYIHTYTHRNTSTQTQAHKHKLTHTNASIGKHIHAYTHTQTQAYAHTYKHKCTHPLAHLYAF